MVIHDCIRDCAHTGKYHCKTKLVSKVIGLFHLVPQAVEIHNGGVTHHLGGIYGVFTHGLSSYHSQYRADLITLYILHKIYMSSYTTPVDSACVAQTYSILYSEHGPVFGIGCNKIHKRKTGEVAPFSQKMSTRIISVAGKDSGTTHSCSCSKDDAQDTIREYSHG